jgi:hypothetical protein
MEDVPKYELYETPFHPSDATLGKLPNFCVRDILMAYYVHDRIIDPYYHRPGKKYAPLEQVLSNLSSDEIRDYGHWIKDFINGYRRARSPTADTDSDEAGSEEMVSDDCTDVSPDMDSEDDAGSSSEEMESDNGTESPCPSPAAEVEEDEVEAEPAALPGFYFPNLRPKSEFSVSKAV